MRRPVRAPRVVRAACRLATVVFVALSGPDPAVAAEVNGIWTEPATKDLGELTGNPFFKNWKIRGWADAYYVYNFNRPGEDTVNDNQGSSIVKGSNISIEGRTFDVHHSRFQMTNLEVELEKVPVLSSWASPEAFGFKIDTNYGDTYDIIHDTIEGALGDDVLNDFDRYFSHYSIGYVAPIGRGLRMDFGKLVTHIGGETIETIKNNNYSHGFLYSYAIPFQDTGFRLNYPWTDTLSTEFYVLQGWNVTWDDNNDGKTFGPSIIWAPSPKFSMYANYLVGPEQRENDSNMRHILDVGFAFNPFDRFNILLSYDYGYEEKALAGGDNTFWHGAFAVFRYKVTDAFEPALRLEFMKDPDGFATGLDQTLYGVTLTLNYRIDLPHGAHLLVRPEYRYDNSTGDFFTKGSRFREGETQHTLGLGVVLYY